MEYQGWVFGKVVFENVFDTPAVIQQYAVGFLDRDRIKERDMRCVPSCAYQGGGEVIIRGQPIDHAANRFLLTSRPSCYVRLAGDIPHFQLPNFSVPQVAEFLGRWQRAFERWRHLDAPDLLPRTGPAETVAEIRQALVGTAFCVIVSSVILNVGMPIVATASVRVSRGNPSTLAARALR